MRLPFLSDLIRSRRLARIRATPVMRATPSASDAVDTPNNHPVATAAEPLRIGALLAFGARRLAATAPAPARRHEGLRITHIRALPRVPGRRATATRARRPAGIYTSTLIAMLAAIIGPTALAAFEIEDETLFPVPAPQQTLRILSTADTELFAPLITAFQGRYPRIEVAYTTVSSTELMTAIAVERAPFDLAVSSAMDLQTKLANDGHTRPHSSALTGRVPGWAKWREHVFAFTQEPAAIVISPNAFAGLEVPRSRQDLIALLRAHPDRFRGRVGTYDVRESGLGYLFATQDARMSETYWRLTEVMGGLDARLYCCSGSMIDDVASGRIAVAYNVLGSYAAAREDLAGRIEIVEPEDFTTVMLRSAVIPVTAEAPDLGGLFIDHLISTAWTLEPTPAYPFPTMVLDVEGTASALRPIPLGPGLLVFLDRLKRDRFLKAWGNAMLPTAP